MGRLRRALPDRSLVPDLGRGQATPKQARRALRAALDQSRRDVTGTEPSKLVLIGQSRGGPDYAAQRRHWQRRARGWGVESWPERLQSGRYALFLAPVSPEAAARPLAHPHPAAMPSFIDFDDVLPPESALAIVISVWLTKVAPTHLGSVALAPPILERYAHGRLRRRELFDYGLEWPLAPPRLEAASLS